MNAADVLQALGETTLATSAAIVLVLLLRGPLRRLGGQRVAYALWAMVPAAAAAVLLPAPVQRVLLRGGAELGGRTASLPGFAQAAGFDASSLLLGAWAAGAMFACVLLARRQRRFVRGLGRVRRRDDGLWQADSVEGLPAAIGLPTRIVLPADFEHRYGEKERRLILAHERLHAQRGDLAINAFAAAFRCAYWFNPLLPLALDRFRRDQELACDEAVLARHPASRRAYGEALLKTSLAGVPAPLACHWPAPHPLKERLAMLSLPSPTARRWIAGTVFVAALTTACGYAAWAAQPKRVKPQIEASHIDAGLPDRPLAQDVASLSSNAPVRKPSGPAAQGSEEHMPITAPPKYPKAAYEAKISGKVVLLVDIAADGSVTHAEVEKATPAGVFEAATLEAAKKWKFDPRMENGEAVPGRVRVPVSFELDRKPSNSGGTNGRSA